MSTIIPRAATIRIIVVANEPTDRDSDTTNEGRDWMPPTDADIAPLLPESVVLLPRKPVPPVVVFAASRSGTIGPEVCVQFQLCKKWAHEDWTPGLTFFTCPNCDSD